MTTSRPPLDLMPPAFSEGLADWSHGDGTPGTPTYDEAPFARIATGDPDFGTCLEMRKVVPVQRLRYMGELPVPEGGFVEISARVKALRGALASVRVAAWAGGAHGRAIPDLGLAARPVPIAAHGRVLALRAVIGHEARAGVDLVWDARVLYAHVGLDLLGPDGAVVRIADLVVRDVTDRFTASGAEVSGLAEEAAPRVRS